MATTHTQARATQSYVLQGQISEARFQWKQRQRDGSDKRTIAAAHKRLIALVEELQRFNGSSPANHDTPPPEVSCIAWMDDIRRRAADEVETLWTAKTWHEMADSMARIIAMKREYETAMSSIVQDQATVSAATKL